MPATLAAGTAVEILPGDSTCSYSVYGFRLRSRIRLTLDEVLEAGTADIELLPGDPLWFEEMMARFPTQGPGWIHMHELEDGRSYLRYDGMFDFQISPSGDRIYLHFLADISLESLQTYVLGRVFSYALVKMGHEPLHASTVVINGKAIAFLGASAFGKSSLAACFVAAGYPLLTDDVLRLEERAGRFYAFPGPPCLKLLQRMARLYLGEDAVGVPINNKTPKAPKLVFPLTREQKCESSVPLAAIYAVSGPRKVYRKQKIVVGDLPPVEALVRILSFTHNHEITSTKRLARQFDAAQRLITAIPVRSLAYPRILSSLEDVRDTVLEDSTHYVDSL